MASRFFTEFVERKLPSDFSEVKQKVGKSGKVKMGKMKVKNIGKTQPKNRTLGVKEVKIYNAKQGLAG